MKPDLRVELYCGSEAIADAVSTILEALNDGTFKIQWIDMNMEVGL